LFGNILYPIRIQIFLDDLKEPFLEIQKTNILENKLSEYKNNFEKLSEELENVFTDTIATSFLKLG
jgi:hypothetical protein